MKLIDASLNSITESTQNLNKTNSFKYNISPMSNNSKLNSETASTTSYRSSSISTSSSNRLDFDLDVDFSEVKDVVPKKQSTKVVSVVQHHSIFNDSDNYAKMLSESAAKKNHQDDYEDDDEMSRSHFRTIASTTANGAKFINKLNSLGSVDLDKIMSF